MADFLVGTNVIGVLCQQNLQGSQGLVTAIQIPQTDGPGIQRRGRIPVPLLQRIERRQGIAITPGFSQLFGVLYLLHRYQP